MLKRLVLLPLLLLTTSPAFGQGLAFFQDGVTVLPGGGIYDGTIDTEFRAANPTEPQGQNPEITVDLFDSGFQTQAAIRFDNLLISQGGLVPDGLARGDILFAELRMWITSPSTLVANVDFNRVIGPDTTSGDFWQEDDTWASLGGDLIPDESGLLDGDPILRDDVEARSVPDFTVDNPGQDSADLFFELGNEFTLTNVDQSFFRFDVTEAVRDWLVDLDPNAGWAISIDSGNGWDFLTSEFSDLSGEFNSSIVTELENLGLSAEDFRPALTVVFLDGPILDLNGDGDEDLDDFQVFLDNLGIELDGPIPTGAPGDFDFDRDVDLDDFKFFKNNFPGGAAGFQAALSGSAAVPEPSTVMLCGLAGMGGLAFRRFGSRG